MPESLTRKNVAGGTRLQIAIAAGFISERCPASHRNTVRLRVVIPGRNKSESATANKMAEKSAITGGIAALASICVDKFQHASGAAANLAELRKVSSSWEQRDFVEKGGWATLPGNDQANSAVAQACANMLDNLK